MISQCILQSRLSFHPYCLSIIRIIKSFLTAIHRRIHTVVSLAFQQWCYIFPRRWDSIGEKHISVISPGLPIYLLSRLPFGLRFVMQPYPPLGYISGALYRAERNATPHLDHKHMLIACTSRLLAADTCDRTFESQASVMHRQKDEHRVKILAFVICHLSNIRNK